MILQAGVLSMFRIGRPARFVPVLISALLVAPTAGADPLYPNYGMPPSNAMFPEPSGFDSFQLWAPYSTGNPFSAADLQAIANGFELFTGETFDGNGRTCASCHLPDKNYNISLEDFLALSAADQQLVLGGTNPHLENEEAVTEKVLFNINQSAGPGTEGDIALPLGPFRSSMSIGGVGLAVLNDHVCLGERIDGVNYPVNSPQGTPCTQTAGTPPLPGFNATVDDGIRDLMLGWSGEGSLAEPFRSWNGTDFEFQDCNGIIAEFATDRSSLRDLDLALATFALAAVKTHFPKTQNREPGGDFDCPTRQQLLDMAQFQKWLGRRFELDITQLEFNAPQAQHGRNLFSTRVASCVACHVNASTSDTQGRVKSDPVPFLTQDGNPDFEIVGVQREDLFIIGTNKSSRNGSQLLELDLIGQSETFDFPFDPGDHQLRGATIGQGRQGGFNVQSIIEAVRNKQFFHNNGVTDSIEDAIEFYFTDAFRASQGGTAISNDFRRVDPHNPPPAQGGTGLLYTPQEARAFLGGDQAVADMGFFLRALSSLYAVADCQRLVDEMIDRLDWYQPVDLPSIHCTFALNDVKRILNGSQLDSNPYAKLTAALNGVNGKLQALTAKLNGAGKNGNAAKVAKVRAEVRAGLVKLAEELLALRRGIALTPELNDPI